MSFCPLLSWHTLPRCRDTPASLWLCPLPFALPWAPQQQMPRSNQDEKDEKEKEKEPEKEEEKLDVENDKEELSK